MNTPPQILFTPDERTPPPRCLRCGYLLNGLIEPRCPECGTAFDPEDPATYTRYPGFLLWKYWLPGFVVAVIGSSAICCLFLANDNVGWGLSHGTPFGLGAILGYGVHRRTRWAIVLALAGVVFVITSAITFHLAGPLCGVILTILFLVPTCIGLMVGSILRWALRDSSFDQWRYLPMLLFLLAPAVVHFAERLAGLKHGPETFASSRTIATSVERVWATQILTSLPNERPNSRGALSLPAPIPLRMSGDHSTVGGTKQIIFNRGQLTLQITDRIQNRLLAFRFTGQTHLEDRAVKLLDGRLKLEAVSTSATRASLSTRYQPLMTPRWYWRPFEHLSGKRVHDDILTELEASADKPGN